MASEPSRLQVFGVVAFYMSSALIMVFVNKAVLNSVPSIPFTFLWTQIIIAVLLLHISQIFIPQHIKLPTVDTATCKKLAAVVVTGIAGLALNTLCLATVDTSFFIIARGLALPFTIILSSIMTKSIPVWRVILASAIVSGGFFVGVYRNGTLADIKHATKAISLVSILFGVASSFFLALHAVLVKSAIKHVDGSIVALTYFSNLLSVGLLLPFVIINGELGAIVDLFTSGHDLLPFIAGSLVTGFFGFLLGIAGLLSIKVTSPITHMFSSAGRSVLQTMLGAFIFGDIITTGRGLSIALITVGSTYYVFVMNTTPRSPKPKSTAEEEEAMLKDIEMGEKTPTK